jgi:hypothetical protein
MNMRAVFGRWAARPRLSREVLALGLAAMLALAGFALLVRQATRPQATAGSGQSAQEPPPAAVSTRVVCSLSNDDARAALVQGADGGFPVSLAGRTYWLFGDTLLLPQSGKQIQPNSIAWSDGTDATGCPKLTYHTEGGSAAPFIEKDGSLTVWPLGPWGVDDHTFDFYTAYVYGSGPYAYWIGEIGLARIDVRTMQVTTLARKLFDASSGFASQVIGAQPVKIEDDGLLRVVLESLDHRELLARVAPDAVARADAYEFWDGSGWSKSTADAAPLWQLPQPQDDVQRLATFENGASIAWNQALGRYVAVLNTGFSSIGVRTAERLEGPWSDPVPLMDCLTFAQPAVPTCYSPVQHPELAGDDGLQLFVTVTRMRQYDTVMVEIDLAPPAAK